MTASRRVLVTESYLEDIADSIRAQLGTQSTYTPAQMSDAIDSITGGGGGGDITVESLSVTQNGTYTAPTGKAYSPVTVNVAGSTPTDFVARVSTDNGSSWTYYDTLQAALNARKTSTGTCIIEAGTGVHLISEQIEFTKAQTVTLMGQGDSSVVCMKGNLTRMLHFNHASLVVTVQNLCFSMIANETQRQASGNGGVIQNIGTLTVTDCTFENCSTQMYGGVFNSSGPITITDCTFENCSAVHGSGVIHFGTSTGTYTISNCIFKDCSTSSSSNNASGGAVTAPHSASLIFKNCTFDNCDSPAATGSSNRGGAVIWLRNVSGSASVTLEDCAFTDCDSPDTYNVLNCAGIATLTRVDVDGDRIASSADFGSDIHVDGTAVVNAS